MQPIYKIMRQTGYSEAPSTWFQGFFDKTLTGNSTIHRRTAGVLNRRSGYRNRQIALLLILFLCSERSFGEVKLPSMVSDAMVLQRNVELKIWGWAAPREGVKISFKGRKYSAVANSNGDWSIFIKPMDAGGPYTMEIRGENNRITLKDILVGDVWLCAGQSNMVHSLALHQQRYRQEIDQANYPAIRQFVIPTTPSLQTAQTNHSNGQWKTATRQTILDFSVVAYFFAKNLYDEYKVPIGLINASVGGTPIEAWISEDGLRSFRNLEPIIARNKNVAYVDSINRLANLQAEQLNASRQNDKGLTGKTKWFDPSHPMNDWRTISIPGYWEDQGLRNFDGVVWYRKEVDIPATMTGTSALLSMGRIVDADDVYVNGTLIGNKTYQYPQRRYSVPSGLLKPGKNSIVVRVINYSGKGGFVPDKPYQLTTHSDTVDLTGYWKYQVGEVYSKPASMVSGISLQNEPTALFNGMIAPCTNYKLKGVLWYQGESNTQDATAYEALLPALIYDWRDKWKQNELPFLYAQLPNFMEVDYLPSESQWAALRNAQLKTLAVPNTAMAVTIDLGEWNDIHPGAKKPIGDRLALAARRIAYRKTDVVYSGPIFTSSSVNGNKVTLTFNHIGAGLISYDGQPLKWFAVAGEDKKYVWANAEIDNNQVILSSDAIRNPVHVRYAWADNPEGVNFFNRDGLPASPFEARVAEEKLWQGKKAAVVLTYDDALAVHLDNAVPALNALGLRATFYVSANAPDVQPRINDWRNVAKTGHELGNHTLYHPCDASKPGRSWVLPENDLSKYTTAQLVREVTMTNTFLQSLDGKTERTFAFTCGDTQTGEGSFVDAIKNQFVSMRGVEGRLNTLNTLDYNNIYCYVVDEKNADQLIAWAEKAATENALLVILFHGVGGGHSLNVDLKIHNNFLSYLKEHSNDYWVTTMLEASKHTMRQNTK